MDKICKFSHLVLSAALSASNGKLDKGCKIMFSGHSPIPGDKFRNSGTASSKSLCNLLWLYKIGNKVLQKSGVEY